MRRRTKARQSEKVASGLRYQAVERGKFAQVSGQRWTIRQTKENSARSTGVVRAMAKSLY
ncbi:hypothetical protein CKO36_19120 [Rhabdochromatium marinum]|nr:hypothetical protein [Rhabdochromatium marinum]